MHSIERINSWLIAVLLFSLPITTAFANIVTVTILILWIFHAKFKEHFLKIKSNKVALGSLIFFSIHIVGLLWSDDLYSGLEVVRKNWKFLMIPIFMIYVRKEHISIYLNAFLLSILLSEFLSYLVWLDIIQPIFKASHHNPTIFMSHVVYNIFLSIAIYIVAARIIFDKKKSNTIVVLLSVFLLTMILNMFITAGRTGQLVFFIVIFILAAQFYKKSILKFLGVSVLISSTIFVSAYSFSPIFKERINAAVDNIATYETNQFTSIGLRMSFVVYGIEIFLDNPLFGLGTGDLESNMEKAYLKNTPKEMAVDNPHINNPHNYHIMVMAQFGLFGLLIFYWFFYNQIKCSFKLENKELSRLGFAIPVVFLVANLGESYLFLHATSLFFSVISAVIFSNQK